MAIVLVFNESSNTKIVLYTYLRLTLNGHYVGWHKLGSDLNIQFLVITAKVVKVGDGAITRLKSL